MALLASPECAQIVALTGADSKYSADCLIRHLLTTGWPGALALGHDPAAPTLTIVAGIGTLTLTATSSDFGPARQPGPGTIQPQPRPAPPEIAAIRLQTCERCSAWTGGKCGAAGCACAGLGRHDLLSSRCPRGEWPSSAAASNCNS